MIGALLGLLSPPGRHGRLSILIFHRVLAAPDPLLPGEMHAARFDATLARLTRWFDVLPLPDAVMRLQAGRLPARALAVTFDDGYLDNRTVALPILRRHGVRASFFIASDYLDGRCMWNDTIIETVRACKAPVLDTGAFGRYPLDDIGARRAAIDSLIGRLKYLSSEARNDAVEALAQHAGAMLPHNLMMRADDVRALHAAGMEIGAHTASHPILTRLSPAQAAADIAHGRRVLEDIIGTRVAGFAYPNGVPDRDYARVHVDIVREQGFDYAVTTAWGAACEGDDVFQLPRFTPWDVSLPRFGLRLADNLRAARKRPQPRARDSAAV